jgi:hypothetical protein
MARVAEALLGGQALDDERHPIDQYLVECGVRWCVLRYVAPPARVDLALQISARTAPDHTRSAISAQVWVDAVDERIRRSRDFRYESKRRRWLQIAQRYADASDRDRRPLTWLAQDDIAAAVGCSTKTVQRCEQWLQGQGLLFELVPGTRLPMMDQPEDENPVERESRIRAQLHKLAEAVAAEEAARQRARAELAAVRAGHNGREAAGIAAHDSPATAPIPTQTSENADDQEIPLINICPVYELRVPMTPAERAEHAAVADAFTVRRSAGRVLLDHHRQHAVHPRNAHVYADLVAVFEDGSIKRATSKAAAEAVTCGYVIGLLRSTENVCPPDLPIEDQIVSSSPDAVDKRRAPRGLDQRGSREKRSDSPAERRTRPSEGRSVAKRRSRAEWAARRLLRSTLDPRLCEDVSESWLAARLRSSGLLNHGWTDQDLADHLHGYPQWPHLPHRISNCRAWISARLSKAEPHLPPHKLQLIDEVEKSSPWFQRRNRQEVDQRELARQAEIAQRRRAIDACGLCDELGWIEVPNGTPTVRCNHDSSTGGW